MTIQYRVNISRPSPLIEDQNKRMCEYIEPLREREKVTVSNAYWFNLNQLKENKPCSLSPGFRYYFWFTEKETAQKFIDDWIKELGVVPYFEEFIGTPFYNELLERNPQCKKNNEDYKDWHTKIVKEEIE